MSLSRVRAKGIEWLRRAVAACYGLRVDWVELSDDAIHGILKDLPEMTPWPREVYALLLRRRPHVEKRTALITQKSQPVGIVGLRRNGQMWEPVTQWILPHAVFPVREGLFLPCLATLGIPVRVGCWRWEALPPQSAVISNFNCYPRYSAKLEGDYQQHWKTYGSWNDVKRKRNRCKGFRLQVNAPGAAEWTIKNSEAKWRGAGGMQAPDLEDRIDVARFLERIGLHFTLTLMDGDKPTAAHTFIADGKCLVWHLTYRDPTYDWYGPGGRLLELSFHWAAECGFKDIDLGGMFEYKKLWAPENGWRGEFEAYHPVLSYLDRLDTVLGAFRRKLWLQIV